jgi:hypothetical protein
MTMTIDAAPEAEAAPAPPAHLYAPADWDRLGWHPCAVEGCVTVKDDHLPLVVAALLARVATLEQQQALVAAAAPSKE